MSFCITASCLAHRREVFILHWPHSPGILYPWVHGNLSPCEAVPPATPEQAGTACAACGCDYYLHELNDGPLPHGALGRDPGRCLECGHCGRFIDVASGGEWTLRRAEAGAA